MIKLPKDFIDAGYKFEVEIPSPKLETTRIPEGSFVLRALYETNEIEEFAQQAAREMSEKFEAAIMDELLRLNGYVPERTCKYIWDANRHVWFCSECGGLEPCSDSVNYCCDCGARVIGNIDERERQWETK